MDEVDLDIVDIINTILPGEKHLLGMNYCGPGTWLDLKLNDDGTPKPGFEPTDKVDKIALTHDLAYSRHCDLKNRNKADKQMICELLNIERPTCRERCERCFVIPIMFVKHIVGLIIIWLMDAFSRIGT